MLYANGIYKKIEYNFVDAIMYFESILFDRTTNFVLKQEAPAFFSDLNLDQIVYGITHSYTKQSNLDAFFYTPLQDEETIRYRQEVAKELESVSLRTSVQHFLDKIYLVRENMPNQGAYYYEYQREKMCLEAAGIYCKAVQTFVDDLSGFSLQSKGFLQFRNYITEYQHSVNFKKLDNEVSKLKNIFGTLQYKLCIKEQTVQVLPFNITRQENYTKRITLLLARFHHGQAKNHHYRIAEDHFMNSVDAQILRGLASLYPQYFETLKDFYASYLDFYDDTLMRFEQEVRFYFAYEDYILPLKDAGLSFCYPSISMKSKAEKIHQTFDLALAQKLVAQNKNIVCNDYYLKENERVMVITGPNQGGKTTFARIFGQIHYLAALGLPVPGYIANVFICDQIFTLFERQEKVENHYSKLEDDLMRMHNIIRETTGNSLVIMNEVLSSTNWHDALDLSRRIMQKIVKLGVLCVWVTFLDELTKEGNGCVVSLTSCISPENLSERTFKIIRRPADGLAYAFAIAEKHGVTYNSLIKRIGTK